MSKFARITKDDVVKARQTGFTFQQAVMLFGRFLEQGDQLYAPATANTKLVARLDYEDLLDSHEFFVQRDLAKAAQHTRAKWEEDDKLPFDNVYVRAVFNCPRGTVVGLHLSKGPDETDGRPGGVPYYQALVMPNDGQYEIEAIRGYIGDYVSEAPLDREVHKNREYRAQDRVIGAWATSFARLIVNRHVKLVEVGKSEAAKRRRGLAERKSFHLVPVPEIKEFVEAVRRYESNRGGSLRYAGAWWVAGHWRYLRAEVYERNSDGSYRRTWILPHIRGQGRIVDQVWVVRERSVERDLL